jgi:hypothetical protein
MFSESAEALDAAGLREQHSRMTSLRVAVELETPGRRFRGRRGVPAATTDGVDNATDNCADVTNPGRTTATMTESGPPVTPTPLPGPPAQRLQECRDVLQGRTCLPRRSGLREEVLALPCHVALRRLHDHRALAHQVAHHLRQCSLWVERAEQQPKPVLLFGRYQLPDLTWCSVAVRPPSTQGRKEAFKSHGRPTRITALPLDGSASWSRFGMLSGSCVPSRR